jgi:uncharacterized cupin superfamily protein
VDVYNINDLQHAQLISSSTGEMFSRSAVLTELLSCQKIFVHHEILPPGKRSSAPHCHTTQEEMIYVMEGYPLAHSGNESLKAMPISYKANWA